MDGNKANGTYEVLNPWAEVDPTLLRLRGISARVTNLEGKKLGLFCNPKIAARPIQDVVEKKLKERFPVFEISRYIATERPNQIATENKARFEEWVKGVDTVIAAVGD